MKRKKFVDIAVGEKFTYNGKKYLVTAVGWNKEKGYYLELKGLYFHPIYEDQIK